MSNDETKANDERSSRSHQSKSILSAALVTLVLQVIGLILQYITQFGAARLCGSESEFGIYGQARCWIQVLGTVAAWGLPTVALRYIPTYLQNKEYDSIGGFLRFGYKRIFSFSLVAGFIGGSFILWYRGADYGAWVMALSLTGVPFCATHLLQMQGTRSLEKIFWTNWPYFLFQPLFFMLLVAIAWVCVPSITASWLAAAFVISLLGTSMLQSVPLWLGLPHGEAVPPTNEQKGDWNSLANQLGISTSAALVLRETDVILVGCLAGDAAAGVYMAATRIARLCSFALNASGSIVGPRVANCYRQGKMKELEHLIQLSTLLSTIATVMIGVTLVFLASFLLRMFGAGFESGTSLVIVLLVGHMVNAATGPCAQVLALTGNQQIASKIYMVAAVLHLLGNVVGVMLFGAMGGAVATSAVLALCNLVMAYLVYQRLGISIVPRFRARPTE